MAHETTTPNDQDCVQAQRTIRLRSESLFSLKRRCCGAHVCERLFANAPKRVDRLRGYEDEGTWANLLFLTADVHYSPATDYHVDLFLYGVLMRRLSCRRHAINPGDPNILGTELACVH